MKLSRLLSLALLTLVLTGTVHATHLRTADVTVERVCGSDLTFKITVTAYLNTLSNTKFGDDPNQGGNPDDDGHVRFGDGNLVYIPAGVTVTPRSDLGPNIGVAVYVVYHTYSSPGLYTITYYERDRSSGILNIPGSGDIPYVSSITVNATNAFGCNRFPELTIPPVDRACLFNAFTHTPGAVDDDGDSLSFELTIPAGYNYDPISGYQNPDASIFYNNPNAGNEQGTGPPVFSIHPETGLITWDAPGMVGEYNIAFKIIEWKKDADGNPVMMSSIVRDMQIIVAECENLRPDFSLFPADICVQAGTVIHGLVRGFDPENKNVKIEVVSEAIDLPANQKPATYTPFPSVFVPSVPQPEVNFTWNTDCIHARSQPYQVVFKITDDPPGGNPLVTFRTWSIRVIAPPPTWKSHTLDLVNRSVTLEWDPYACPNASAIQIWRKVGSNPFSVGSCEIGINRNTGYELIGTVNASETTFTDDNRGGKLAVAAQYCYRLVASFSSPYETRSKVSQEECVEPIMTDAPVITHVSVEKTASDGDIRVSWRSPFNINKVQFPGPYNYEVYRAKGFIEEMMPVKAGMVSDTTFLDQGINTSDSVFNYRIVIYSKTQNSSAYIPIDTSSVASSIWLTGVPGLRQIELAWRDSVPWSNVAIEKPRHLIYRGLSEDNMILYDSVIVSDDGRIYIDNDIDDTILYYYKVKARGTYGNPKIAIQENFSQILSLYPQNDLLPCVPVASIAITDCEAFRQTNTCGQSQFSNSISWSLTFSDTCRSDIRSYNVYAAPSTDGEYQLIAANVKEPLLIETGLPSFARCYRVSAIDGLGQEGPMSDPVCNDNCPYYELPNVFTPNGDGCNDFLSASDEDEAVCEFSGTVKCARFVKEVRLHVYNRWGKEVYTFNSGDGRSVYIDWDGRDTSGNLLEAAVYYYVADVTFTTVDPDMQSTKIKGWVQLVY